eukprot:2328484-Pleurochrysis_carterae.AAC.2
MAVRRQAGVSRAPHSWRWPGARPAARSRAAPPQPTRARPTAAHTPHTAGLSLRAVCGKEKGQKTVWRLVATISELGDGEGDGRNVPDGEAKARCLNDPQRCSRREQWVSARNGPVAQHVLLHTPEMANKTGVAAGQNWLCVLKQQSVFSAEQLGFYGGSAHKARCTSPERLGESSNKELVACSASANGSPARAAREGMGDWSGTRVLTPT